MKRAKANDSRLHLFGLLSDGGVHSHITHLYALLKCAKDNDIKNVYVHCFGDGRDTDPKSATKYLKALQDHIKELGIGEISDVTGRYYAMDRDKRWERVTVAYEALVDGKGDKCKAEDLIKTVEENYDNKVTDEFLKPIICGSEDSRVKSEHTSRVSS